MLPENKVFPEFVPDQLLTSDNLNQLFSYLDEQDRISRVNLTGIGIVCGLKVKFDSADAEIKITAGCGITSEGYLISIQETSYKFYNSFNALIEKYYDKFVNVTDKSQIPLWELKKQTDSDNDVTNPFHRLNDPSTFLNNKVVMLFVELLEADNKNCEPGSCDDKGKNIKVNIRVLLVDTSNVSGLITASNNVTSSSFNSLPYIALPRWDVAGTGPITADSIIAAYKNILTQNFITNIQSALSTSYQNFRQAILDEYSSDPFAAINLVTKFAFLYNGSINTNQSIHIQYYYDFFSDLIAAYNEFRMTGYEVISTCCPDKTLFPRHLLLGEATSQSDETNSSYRHYFIYSPLFQKKDLLVSLKFLFRRMDLMLKNFLIPASATAGTATDDSNIKITPSSLSQIPLSAKAIPYYYTPKVLPKPLYLYWSAEKLLKGKSEQILSYNSEQYASEDFVKRPLLYDLEPYNFFRIEGIAGKSITRALSTIQGRIKNFRLPLHVIALATGNPKSGDEIKDTCCFPDIQLQYELLRKEILCCLRKDIEYWGSLEKNDDGKGNVSYQLPKAYATYVKVKTISQKTVKSTMTNIKTDVSSMTKNYQFISKTFAEAYPSSISKTYMEYQLNEKVNMTNLPAPKTNSAEQTIPYYILIIIDELEELVALLATEKVEDFNAESFISHADKLKETYASLTELASGYHSKDYLIAKIKLNTSESKSSDIDKIDKAMSIMSDDDAYKIILLLLNLDSTASFISQLEAKKGSYSDQHTVISTFYNRLDKDGMMIPIIKEPAGTFKSDYDSMLEKLKREACLCEMNNFKFLIEQYKAQQNKLSDLNNFSVYAQNHPGLQHKAGVTAGGTFLIVYKGSRDTTPNITADTVIADFFIPYIVGSNCPPVQFVIQEIPNKPPVANAGAVKIITSPANTSTLDGSASRDEDGTIEEYKWTMLSGPAAAVITNDSLAQSSVTALDTAGDYVFQLTVTDDKNASASATTTITVVAANQLPVARAGNDITIQLPLNNQQISLDGSSSSDPDGTIKTYLWTKIGRPDSGTIENPDLAKTNVTNLTDGDYEFLLTVTDDRDGTSSDNVLIHLIQPNLPPLVTASANPNGITLPENQITLFGTGSDPENSLLSFLWEKTSGPDGISFNPSDTNESPTVTFLNSGTYKFRLTVTDDKGASTSSPDVTVTVLAANIPPVANAGPDVTVASGSNVTLDGSASTDQDGTIVKYFWAQKYGPLVNIIDGDKKNPTILGLNNTGDYIFELIVTDDDNAVSSPDSVTVKVTKNLPPIVTASANPNNITLPVNQITLIGSGSDPENSQISFLWEKTSGPDGISFNPSNTTESPTVTFLNSGTYKFMLTVTDDKGASSSSPDVTVQVNNTVVNKVCLNPGNLISEFLNLQSKDPDNFNSFTDRYIAFNDISNFYSQFQNVINKSTDDQIEFFLTFRIQLKLVTWINLLTTNIKNGNFKNLMTLVLNLLLILIELIIYIVCIQSKDIDASGGKNVPMQNALNAVLSVSKVIKISNAIQRSIVQSILALLNADVQKVKNDGEDSIKVKYLKILKDITEVLESKI